MSRYLFTAMALVAPALAQVAECNGLQYPDWKGCDTVWDLTGFEGSTELLSNDCSSHCSRWTDSADAINCELSLCWMTDACVGQTASTLKTYYFIVDDWCREIDSGGKTEFDPANLPGTYFSIYNNPDYKPAAGGRRTRATTELDGLALTDEVNDSGIRKQTFTLEDFEAYVANTHTEKAPKDVTVPAEKREDVTWTTLLSGKSVPQPGVRHQASNPISSGFSETWTFTSTLSSELSVSVEVSAGFLDIFSASVGVTASLGMSESIASGQTFTAGTCPNLGVVYFEPVFDWWQGYFSDNPDVDVDIYVPLKLNDQAAGRWVTVCQG